MDNKGYPPITPGWAIYLPGFLFCLGIQITQVPWESPPLHSLVYIIASILWSLTSWLGAGMALIPPP